MKVFTTFLKFYVHLEGKLYLNINQIIYIIKKGLDLKVERGKCIIILNIVIKGPKKCDDSNITILRLSSIVTVAVMCSEKY